MSPARAWTLGLVLIVGIHPAAAKTPARVCRAACGERIAACAAAAAPFGITASACKRAVIKVCRKQGVDACPPSTTTTTTTATTSPPPTTTLPATGVPLLDGAYGQQTIADWFAFVSYDDATKATLILDAHALREPAHGPTYHPFDPALSYEMHVDNDHDALEDVTFRFRFLTELRLPASPAGFLGVGAGIMAPGNSPAPVAPGTLLIPPAITALDGAGSDGLGVRQTYTVTMVRGRGSSAISTDLGAGRTLFAVPSNVGPRTMPAYDALAQQGVYDLDGGVRVFAGTVDDPTYAAAGALFDTLNFYAGAAAIPGVLSASQDADDTKAFAADDLSGFDVNAIALEVPITWLTADGNLHAATDPQAVVGTHAELWLPGSGRIHRRGNALLAELIVGTGSRDAFAQAAPADDAAVQGAVRDPLLARWLNAAYGGAVAIPTPPRTDLDLLLAYEPPICPGCSAADVGPPADLLRLNLGVAPTAQLQRRRLGLLAGDAAGYPNGRRVSDDVTDVSLRLIAGVLAPGFDVFPNNALGDGVNTNDRIYQETFPYVAFANGRDSRHVDPAEAGCASPTVPFLPMSCPSN